MNLSLQPVQEQVILQTIDLIRLFELKGYECSVEVRKEDTCYTFNAKRDGRIDYIKEPSPNWQVIRNNNLGVDWL